VNLEEEFMQTAKRLAMVLGFVGGAMVLGVLIYHAGKAASDNLVRQLQSKVIEVETNAIAAAAAPPGFSYCTDPAYYIRACEAGPYSRRYTGTPGCPSIAICGNHARPCEGDDGATYPIIGQQGANGLFATYPEPADSAGPGPKNKWTDCYVNHIDVFGSGYPCSIAVAPPGRLTYQFVTLAQVPEPQRDSFCSLYHCTIPACGGSSTTPTPTAIAQTPTPAQGGSVYAPWIEQIYHEGITAGCQTSPPLYCPLDAVSREQIAVYLLKLEHGSGYVPPQCTGIFNDVPCNSSMSVKSP
jgi:hypothetical protein